MMDGSQEQSGFDPHVWNQLNQAAQDIRNSQRGRGPRGRGRGHGRGQHQPPVHHINPDQAPYQGPPPGIDAFPPLGSSNLTPAPSVASNASSSYSQNVSHQPRNLNGYPSQAPRMEFFDHSRGRARGRYYHQQSRQTPPPQPMPPQQVPFQSDQDFRRPPVPHGRLYQQARPTPPSWPFEQAPDAQKALKQKVMAQSDYLNHVQQSARSQYQLKKDEQLLKEAFRKRLEKLCQDSLSLQYPGANVSDVRLKCYGSLNNGFGLANCDMDLLLAIPDGIKPTFRPNEEGQPDPLKKVSKIIVEDENSSSGVDEPASKPRKEKFAVGWLLEEALLREGIGARLLTQTRVPILKVCERASEQLLKNLRRNHEREIADDAGQSQRGTDVAHLPPVLDMAAVHDAISDLEDQDTAAEVSLPEGSDKPVAADLEFEDDCGIKCDINFSNFVALHNTRLLREYCLYDSRVAEVGVFVKAWAKIRDINTPYWGTLSSYGYILMVLHYLMNICTPPVIPNLQYLAVDEDAWKGESPELFEGKYDIRFWTDKERLRDLQANTPPNRESTGQLLRGFFWYYASWEGFNFKNDVISIRTKGGLVRKNAKNWTEGKWVEGSDNKKVRQRYLLAIEDPFETEHNVGRVVGHHGIVAIRDEFRRAWNIVSRIDNENGPYEELLQPAEQRGDLLRKDAENHKEKMRQMRVQMEEKERKLRDQALQETGLVQENGMSSDNESSSRPLSPPKRSKNRRKTNTKLTQYNAIQGHQRQNSNARLRLVKYDSDSDADNEQANNTISMQQMNDTRSPKNETPEDEVERDSDQDEDKSPEPFFPDSDLPDNLGFDADGNLTPWPATSEGRWLRWRDRKIKQGRWNQLSSRSLYYHLDRCCPHHPGRPLLEDAGEYKRYECFERAPFPLQNDVGVSSSQQKLANRVLPTAQNCASQKTDNAQERTSDGRANDAVGWPIPWDTTSRGGKWLRKRDVWIRSGTFKATDHKGMYQRLHYLFPYNPRMSRAQLEDFNADLRAYHMNSIDRDAPSRLPRKRPSDFHTSEARLNRAFELRMFSVPVDKASEEQDSEVHELGTIQSDEGEHRSDGLYHSLRLTEELQRKISQRSGDDKLDSTPSLPGTREQTQETTEAGAMPDLAFVRSRRLAFYAQQAKSEASSDEVNSEVTGPTIEKLMAQVGIHSGKPEPVEAGSVVPGHGNKTEDGTQAELTQGVADHPGPSKFPVQLRVDENQPSGTEFRVPSTLYPHLSKAERPRDEDPHIMPIPRKQHFRFDTRQLRDLAVINEGGNGCARQGSEFEVEDEYEWGGGGEMGFRQNSDMAQADTGGHAELKHEYGSGDKEGLLEELPACGFDD